MKLFSIIRRLLFHNFKEKVASLCIALGLWSYFKVAQISNVDISIPVSYSGKPPDLILLSESPNFINAELTGKDTELRFSSANLAAKVDLSNAKAGRNRFMAVFDSNQLPAGIKIRSINSEIILDFDTVVSKRVPVRLSTVGALPGSFLAGIPELSPSTTLLTGSQAALGTLSSISTEPIDFSDLKTDYAGKVKILLPNKKGITSNPENVNIRLPIYALTQTNVIQLSEVPVKVENTPPGYIALIDPLDITITMRGDSKALDRISTDSMFATVTVEANQGKVFKNRVKVGFKESSQAKILNVEPEYIQVRLKSNEEEAGN